MTNHGRRRRLAKIFDGTWMPPISPPNPSHTLDDVQEPGRGKVRAARGLTMSAACLLLPTAAHITAGGGVPASFEFVLAAALLSIACVALADRRRNPVEIAGVMVLSQPPLHLLLNMAGHGHADASDTPGMLFAHAAAAAVLTVLLAGAESVLWVFVALSTTYLFSRARQLLLIRAETTTAVAAPAVPVDVRTPYTVLMAASAPRRGPPSLATAAVDARF